MQQERQSKGRGQARANRDASVKGRAIAQEDPREGGQGQRTRVPRQVAGVLLERDGSPSELSHSLVPHATLDLDIPGSDDPQDYKGISLRNIGRDRQGKVIPHVRRENIARQISIWVAGGYDVNAIALRLNIRPGLIKEHYGVELATGAERVGMDMTSHIVARAKKSDRMAIFYAKSRMNWRDGDTGQTDVSPLNIHIHG